MKNILLAVITSALFTACISMSPSDTARYQDLKFQGYNEADHRVKNPGVAGALNILPGFGNFYLAPQDPDQWIVGFCNLFLWPLSVVWGVPQAVSDASTLNKKAFIYYYTEYRPAP